MRVLITGVEAYNVEKALCASIILFHRAERYTSVTNILFTYYALIFASHPRFLLIKRPWSLRRWAHWERIAVRDFHLID